MHAKEILRTALNNPKTVLNLGSGKIDEFFFHKVGQLVVNVDRSYRNADDTGEVELMHSHMMKGKTPSQGNFTWFVSMDIFDFLDSYKYKFDMIIANRIFEHKFYDSGSIGRMLSACHYLLSDKGKMYILVPNHYLLSNEIKRLETEEFNPEAFAKIVLELNTEFHNTESDPHGSTWSPRLARYYIESEGVWLIEEIYPEIKWDGRDCYMMIIVSKKKNSI